VYPLTGCPIAFHGSTFGTPVLWWSCSPIGVRPWSGSDEDELATRARVAVARIHRDPETIRGFSAERVREREGTRIVDLAHANGCQDLR
jgi:hypothetical protein